MSDTNTPNPETHTVLAISIDAGENQVFGPEVENSVRGGQCKINVAGEKMIDVPVEEVAVVAGGRRMYVAFWVPSDLLDVGPLGGVSVGEDQG